MLRLILIYGIIAGLIVAVPMNLAILFVPNGHSEILGYTLMLVALTFVFVGVKRYRDKVLGGVIKFLPALLVGLGITAVAGVFYVTAWEISLAATNYEFLSSYPQSMIARAEANGATAAELEALRAQMAEFSAWYANPFLRVPATFFVELFPVGLIVSLISAALLRNSRFLPARQPIAA